METDDVSMSASAFRIVEEELRRLPSKGWAALIRKPHIGLRSAALIRKPHIGLRSAALIRKPHIGLRSAAMIRKVYEVDPTLCPKCGSFAVLMASMSAGG